MKPLVGLIMGSRSDWETMSHAAQTLEQLGVPSNQVKTEVFIGRERPVISPPEPADPREAPPISVSGKVEAAPPASTQPGAAPTVAVVSFARSHQTALLLAGKTVLDASEDVGVNIEYSCRIGVCGVCKVKLLSGSVTMEVEEGLDAGDRQKGLILACQAKSSADVSVDA